MAMSIGRAMPFERVCSVLRLLALFFVGAGSFGGKLPSSFLPEEDQGYIYMALQLPDAASLERTDQAARKIEDVLSKIPGVKYTTTVVGFSLLSIVQDTYSAFFFVTLKPWRNERSRRNNTRQSSSG